MSRGAAARRRRPDDGAWLAVCGRVEGGDEDERRREQQERLREEVARLRDQLEEVEGWYRLLQAEHAALQDNDRRSGLRATELQAEVNRLDVENGELHALLSRAGDAGPHIRGREDTAMFRFASWVDGVRKYRWAAAAAVTIATLLARDAAVQGVLARASAGVRQAAGLRDGRAGESDDSGFVRFAEMVNSRDQLERARKAYNEQGDRLKGDSLLEAQDRLRAAKARDRRARLAFYPELARRCEHAHVALPRDAAEALAALNDETND